MKFVHLSATPNSADADMFFVHLLSFYFSDKIIDGVVYVRYIFKQYLVSVHYTMALFILSEQYRCFLFAFISTAPESWHHKKHKKISIQTVERNRLMIMEKLRAKRTMQSKMEKKKRDCKWFRLISLCHCFLKHLVFLLAHRKHSHSNELQWEKKTYIVIISLCTT